MAHDNCFHCGSVCTSTAVVAHEQSFCCTGCRTVYELLHETALCDYYDLNAHPGVAQKTEIWKDKYAFLENAAVKQKIVAYSNGKQAQLTLYLPQIHCSSCLWLLENIHKLNAGILSCTINFSQKEAFILYDEAATSLRGVVETLTAIGYEPLLNLNQISEKNLRVSYKTRLYKIGVAGFCFSNIMMLSFPEYLANTGGEVVEALIGNTLRYLIVALSLPVVFFAATEFFASAWAGLRNRFLNIDAPIALAIAVTFLRSLYEIGNGIGSGYLDSMSGIVFFMLIGRWLQDRTYQSISFDRDFKSFFPIAVNVVKNGIITPTIVSDLRVNDVIQIHAYELVPVDSLLSRGEATLDYSFVSGESLPVAVAIGEIVYAGGKQMAGLIELVVVKEMSQSYLTNLWNKDRQKDTEPAEKHSFIHLLSRYFTFIVFAIALLAGGYWWLQGEIITMWNVLTTVLIVACPCALLLSATYTNGNILRILSQNGFYLRHPDVIEALADVQHIVFDKTGTLTQNNISLVKYEGAFLSKNLQKDIAALLQQSNHPLSRAVYSHIKTLVGGDQIEQAAHFKETKGGGIEGWVANRHIKLGSAAFLDLANTPLTATSAGSRMLLAIDNQYIGTYFIANRYRLGIADLLKTLKKRFGISVLSGDNDTENEAITQLIGDSERLFNQKPHEKLDYIAYLQTQKAQKVMMIGDGLNDAVALQQSDIGIAVTDGDNTFTPASDGIISAPQLVHLPRFMALAVAGKRIIHISFAISIIYNIIGLFYAVQGLLSPVVAAILMPSSSISIVLLTYGLSEWRARQLNLK